MKLSGAIGNIPPRDAAPSPESSLPQADTIALRAEQVGEPDLRRLYDEHASYVRALLRRLLGPAGDPDDVVQDVFLVAITRRELLETGTALRTLCSIAVNLAAKARRRARLRRFFGLDAAPALTDGRTPHHAAERAEANRIVYGVLDKMSEKRRTVFVLYELQGFTGQEIAEIVGCPLKTVWTRLFHARREFVTQVQALDAAAPGRSGGR